MAAITASMVAELRAKTDAPMMGAKKPRPRPTATWQKAENCCASSSGTKAGKAARRVAAEGRGGRAHRRRPPVR